MAKYPLNQSSPKRAWINTWDWLQKTKLGYIIGVVVLGMASGLVIPSNDATIIYRLVCGAIGAVQVLFALGLITYIIFLFITPYRQRNEARKLYSSLLKPQPISIPNKKELIRSIGTLTQISDKFVVKQELSEKLKQLEKADVKALGIPKITISELDRIKTDYSLAIREFTNEKLLAGDALNETLNELNDFLLIQVSLRFDSHKPIGIDGKPILLGSVQFSTRLIEIRDKIMSKINDTI